MLRCWVLLASCSLSMVAWSEGATRQSALADTLLQRAEQALARGRLTLPTYDNAFDQFTAVLLLNPDNEQAKAGLQAVLLAYIDLIRAELAASRPERATFYLHRALEYYPGEPRLLELQNAVKAAHARAAQQAQSVEQGVIDLPSAELTARGEAIRQRLQALAHRIRASDASVWIYARTDEEGRYIYSVMKAAVPGYRIRGDIRIDPRPRLQLREPL